MSDGRYRIGVMTMEVEGKDSERFMQRVEGATEGFKLELAEALGGETAVAVELLTFRGPHFVPRGGAYPPLDFLRVGMTEKLERGLHFLLIVTEVDLASTTFSYTAALPSRLTNVAVVSTKRLGPEFWGREPDEAATAASLTTLLLHSFGHLLNLGHVADAGNVMHDIASVEDLGSMRGLTEDQRARMRAALPREAHERVSGGSAAARWGFVARMLVEDWRSIGGAVVRANPLRLITRLPTMVTAALSVILVLFFSPEVWDVASTVEWYQLAGFAVLAVLTATAVLYRAFAFGGLLVMSGRGGAAATLAESTVVTAAATLLSLLSATALLLVGFMGLAYLGTVTIFPPKLMETWPTVDPATRVRDHVKLSLFVATLGTLAGSLGGKADSKDLVRGVLFVDEET